MAYLLDSSKWKAYQFSDPFAAGSFFVCNKLNKFFCRPDCDARPVTNLKSEIKFVTLSKEALSMGYIPCSHCDPLSYPSVNVQLLVDCVASINKKIGFLPPLIDENEEMNNQRIKENIIENKKHDDVLKTVNNYGAARRSSVPVINYDGKLSKDFDNSAISKNDSDHYRLVDLACRHLALAAAMNVFQPLSPKCPSSPEESHSPNGSKKRRRRGGVLGFKELAAKSKLSAWHFHRVFKSVTGLTPKNYGDKCWEFVKNYKDNNEKSKSNQETEYETPLTSINSSAPESPEIVEPVKKKVRISPDAIINTNDATNMVSTEQLSPVDSVENFSGMNENNITNESVISYPESNIDPLEVSQPVMSTNFNLFNDQMQSSFVPNTFFNKALSVPDLTKYNVRSRSLFDHVPRVDDDKVNTTVPTNTIDFTSKNTLLPDATEVDAFVNDNNGPNNGGNMIDEFSNLIDSSVDEFNMNFQTQMEQQDEFPLGNDLTEMSNWTSDAFPEFVPTNIGF